MSLKKFDEIIGKINQVNQLILVSTIVIMFVVLLAQIGSRFIFFVPLPWSQDVLVFFLIASVFFGVGSAVAAKKEIALEFLVHSFPEKIRNKFMVFADLVSVAFLGVVIYQAIVLIGKTKGAMVGASPIPVSYYYLIVALGCVLMVVNYINHLLKKVFVEKSGEE